jgi:hypothetical protein
MFRSSTILRELVWSLAKVTLYFVLKLCGAAPACHKFTRYSPPVPDSASCDGASVTDQPSIKMITDNGVSPSAVLPPIKGGAQHLASVL